MILLSPVEKVILSQSGARCAQIKPCLQFQNNSKQICLWILMWEGNMRWTRKQYYRLWNDLFLTNKQLFISQDINWWTGVMRITCGLMWCFPPLFELSFWRHPFTAEYSLVSKWCNANCSLGAAAFAAHCSGCVFTVCVCSLLCVCVGTWIKWRAQIPHVTFTSLHFERTNSSTSRMAWGSMQILIFL